MEKNQKIVDELSKKIFADTNDGKDILSETKSKLVKIILENQESAYDIVKNFIILCFQRYKNEQFTEEVILETMNFLNKSQILTSKEENQLLFGLVSGIVISYLSLKKEVALAKVISNIIKKNPNLTIEVIGGFSKSSFSVADEKTIQKVMLEIMKQKKDFKKINKNLNFEIILAFIYDYFLIEREDLTQNILVSIIEQNPDLAYTTINSLNGMLNVVNCNLLRPVERVFNNILDKVSNQKLRELIEPFSIVIVSRYIENLLFVSKNRGFLPKCNRDIYFERTLLGLLKKCNVVSPDIKKFEDIEVNSIVDKWVQYFNNKIEYNGIDCGNLSEMIPYVLRDFAKDRTIQYLFENKNLKNFYRIETLNNDYNIQLEVFEKKSMESGETFVIQLNVPTNIGFHEVVFVIENGKKKAIDSSFALAGIFGKDIFFNNVKYQENGTCYLNAGIAFKILVDLANKKPLKNALIELHEIKDGQQNIVSEISKEVVKFYELLEQTKDSKIVVDEYTHTPKQTPSSELLEMELLIDEDNKDLAKQIHLLKKEVKRLEIDRSRFIIFEDKLVKALEALDYNVQYVVKNSENAPSINRVVKSDKIIATKNENICKKYGVNRSQFEMKTKQREKEILQKYRCL